MKPSNLEQIVETLHNAAAQLELVSAARAAVEARLDSVDSVVPVKFRDQIEISFVFQKLCFNTTLGYSYFETKLELCLRGDGVGDYRLISYLDGETADDYYEIYTYVEWDDFTA